MGREILRWGGDSRGAGGGRGGGGRREVSAASEDEEEVSEVGKKWKSPRRRSAHLLEWQVVVVLLSCAAENECPTKKWNLVAL